MRGYSKMEVAGIILFILAIVFFILEKVLKTEFFLGPSGYGSYFFGISVGVWILGFMQRRKKSKKN